MKATASKALPPEGKSTEMQEKNRDAVEWVQTGIGLAANNKMENEQIPG